MFLLLKIIRMKFLLVIFVMLTSSITGTAQNLYSLKATVNDRQSGELIPAKIYITTLEGVPIAIEGNHEQVDYLSKKWTYCDGNFSVSSPHQTLIVEIRKGLEYVPLKDTVQLGLSSQKDFHLQRWVNMIEKGFVGGDIHGHYMLLDGPGFMKEVLLQMKAEDLPVLNILACEKNTVTPHFTGKMDTNSTSKHSIYVGQEVRDWQMGHLTLIGITKLVEGYPYVGGLLEDWNRPHWLMNHAMQEVRKQNGLVVWSHFSNLPGAESPIAIALGMIDAIELITFNEPTDLPSHWGPWNNSGMSMAEFPVMRGMDLYYQYLNAGFKLPIVAGTDKMENDIPIGSNRYYAKLKGDDQYRDWVSGIKKGNGFVTNGPMLDFTVDNLQAGDNAKFTETRFVKAHVIAKSILPFITLEIIKNGSVVGHKTVFVKDNPPVNGVYTMQLDTIVELKESSWLAARVADDPDNRNRILPRGLSVFAHTNPIYFYRNNQRIKEQASIVYLIKYVHAVINWLEKKPSFENPADRTAALRLAKKALGVYKNL